MKFNALITVLSTRRAVERKLRYETIRTSPFRLYNKTRNRDLDPSLF
jgi:hypothetical protein